MLLRCPRVLGEGEGIMESDIYIYIYVFGVLRIYIHATDDRRFGKSKYPQRKIEGTREPKTESGTLILNLEVILHPGRHLALSGDILLSHLKGDTTGV